MAPTSTLPDDILCRIFEWLITPIQNTNDFKVALEYLVVCSKWRQCALPYVYKTIFITGHDFECFESEAAARETGIKLETNIKLATITGNHKLAKVLNISLFGFGFAQLFVESFISLFQFNSYKWSGIKTLTLTVLPFDADSAESPETKKYLAGIDAVCRDMVGGIPGIKKLSMSCCGSTNLQNNITAYLADSYCNTLEHYESNSVPLMASTMFSQLTSFAMDFSETTQNCIPLVSIESLRVIKMLNISPAFEWQRLVATNCEASSVEFSNVEKMYILFMDHQHDMTIDNSVPVCFPKLKSLSLVLPSFEVAEAVILGGKYRWPKVEELIVRGLNYPSSDEVSMDEMFRIHELGGTLSKHINKQMPFVSRLCLQSDYDPSQGSNVNSEDNIDNSDKSPMTELVRGYSKQLTHINIPYVMEWDVLEFLQSLTCVTLNIGGELPDVLKNMNTRILQYLNFSGIKGRFSWDVFSKDLNGVVRFDCLKYLFLFFAETPDEQTDLSCLVDDSGIFCASSNVLCPRIEDVRINGVSYKCL